MNRALVLIATLASLTVLAADKGEKTVTIQGEGMCAKCALKEKDSCQNVIQETKSGKKTTYYLVQNQVSKDFHKNICTEKKKISATGTVKEVNGKKELTPTKIELVKE